MPEPTTCCAVRNRDDTRYCDRCDLLVGLPGLRVIKVDTADDGALVVTVESPRTGNVQGCRECGVIAESLGRVTVGLVDAPAMGRRVRVVWRKRRWRCLESACQVGSFVEQDEQVAAPRAALTVRACRWAIGQIRREHASVNGVRRQLGVGWSTLWSAIRPMLVAADKDPARFDGVTTLGVDEHVWHHVSTKDPEHGGRGPKELTGMVDLTRDTDGRTRARLLDLVPGRSGEAFRAWLEERGEQFKAGVKVATLDPFHGYKNAIDDQLDDARAVLDAFHVVKLGTQAVDEVRRRVQQDLHGHRGRKNDPLYRIRIILRCAADRLTDRQLRRLADVFADERHLEVELAYRCAQQLRAAYHQPDYRAGRSLATTIIARSITAQSPRSPDSARPSSDGAKRSSATSTPTARTTA